MSFVHPLTDTITLDSKDRESYSTSTTDFDIKLPFSTRQTNFIHIRKILIPLVMDNITSSNNSFEIDDVAGTIDPGQYTIGGLVDWMTTDITGYTISWEDNSRIKITNDSSTVFTWEPGTAGELLGFTQTTYTGVANYTAENFPNLLPTNYITLHSSFISSRQNHNHYHSDNRSDMITFIEMGNLGEVLVWEPEEPLLKNVISTNNDIIDFDFRDDSNNTIDIQTQTVVIEMDRVTRPGI